MRERVRKMTTVMLTTIIILSSLVFSSVSVEATQDRTYNFYTNYNLTGNPVDDIVSVAMAQQNRTKASMGYTEAWCADFVGDCADLAGLSYAIPRAGYCGTLWDNIINSGGYEVSSPQKGDIIFYYCTASYCPNSGKPWVHVGIMTSSSSSIEGNSGGKVTAKSKITYTDTNGHTYGHAGTNSVIVKYLRPKYKDEQIHNPIGAIETIENSNGKVHVSGWAYDPDNTSAALQIHVYVGGEYGSSSVVSAHSNIIANKDSSHVKVGGYHRFDEYIETTARGNQNVFIYAIDATGDGPMMIGSNNIIINTLPTGRVESFSGGNAKIHVVGWVYDPDNSADSLRLDVYIGGAYGETSVVSAHSIYADKDSDDVNNKFGITGKHRFDAWINTSANESQPIYVYAIDSNEPNQNYMIGSDNVIINHNPLGHIDSINEIPGGYCVSGWTFDPDKPSESISVHFYTGAPYGNESAEGFNSGITDIESEDVNNQYGITGKHRFCKKIYTNKTGDQTIYMYGMKIDSYYHPITYQANIFLSSNPVAELEEFQYDNEEVYIKGWAYDKENINYPLNIRIYCDEELISTAIANENSEDINSSHAGKIGNDHRFESRINYNTTNISYGVHKIKIVAENIANGIDYTIDERNIVISRVGDTNLDGKITIRDVTAIQRHIAELEVFTDDQLALADTNGDDKIDISDATYLQMYIAEYDGIVLGKS